MKKTELQVVYRETSDLIPYVNNARTHSDDQVTQIASSIKEFGFNNPILIDGENGIIAGHGRVLAAKKLGLEKVPCIELSGLSEAKKKAYILADNRIALNSGWDYDILRVELEDLNGGEVDSSLMGFDLVELDAILKDPTESLEEESEETESTERNSIIQYNIVFDDDEQQQAWFDFVKKLKGMYPDEETIGARLARYLCEDVL